MSCSLHFLCSFTLTYLFYYVFVPASICPLFCSLLFPSSSISPSHPLISTVTLFSSFHSLTLSFVSLFVFPALSAFIFLFLCVCLLYASPLHSLIFPFPHLTLFFSFSPSSHLIHFIPLFLEPHLSIIPFSILSLCPPLHVLHSTLSSPSVFFSHSCSLFLTFPPLPLFSISRATCQHLVFDPEYGIAQGLLGAMPSAESKLLICNESWPPSIPPWPQSSRSANLAFVLFMKLATSQRYTVHCSPQTCFPPTFIHSSLLHSILLLPVSYFLNVYFLFSLPSLFVIFH